MEQLSKTVLSRWQRFIRLTVWHPINTDPADDHRWGPRLWLPTYDIMALILGIYALVLGSPLLNRIFPEWGVNLGGIAVIIAAIAMLVGVCFPKLALLELIGKMLMIFLLSAYSATVWAYPSTAHGEPNGFVVIILVMAVWLLLPRVTVLFAQLSRRRLSNRQVREVRRYGSH